jgi:hypothetical protein
MLVKMDAYSICKSSSWNKWICAVAAEYGHLEILKYARDNGCEWDASICSSVAENGHFQTLKYAHENG